MHLTVYAINILCEHETEIVRGLCVSNFKCCSFVFVGFTTCFHHYGLVYQEEELVYKLLTIYVENEISLLCVFHVQVVSGSLDPEFEETFEFQVPREEFSSR